MAARLSTDEKIRRKLKEIEKLKQRLCDTRDKLREVADEVNDLCDTMDRADQDIDLGLSYIEDGLDAASELI